MSNDQHTVAHAGALDRIEDQLRLGVADLQRTTLTLAALGLAIASGDPDRIARATEALEQIIAAAEAEANRLGGELTRFAYAKRGADVASPRSRALGLGGLPAEAMDAAAAALGHALRLAAALRPAESEDQSPKAGPQPEPRG